MHIDSLSYSESLKVSNLHNVGKKLHHGFNYIFLSVKDMRPGGHRPPDEMGFNRKNSYTLFLLTLAFVIGEVSHFLIGVLSQDMAQSLHYGDKSCQPHSNITLRFGRTQSECQLFDKGGKIECEIHQGCQFLENGQGMKYQILAGPTFVVVFTISGILMGYLADKTSR